MLRLFEKEIKISVKEDHDDLLSYLANTTQENLTQNESSVRFVVSKTDNKYYHCEIGILRADNDTPIDIEKSR